MQAESITGEVLCPSTRACAGPRRSYLQPSMRAARYDPRLIPEALARKRASSGGGDRRRLERRRPEPDAAARRSVGADP